MKQRVAIVQRDIAWQSVDANLNNLERMLKGVEADVVVLSEMFQTGFVTEPMAIADDGGEHQKALEEVGPTNRLIAAKEGIGDENYSENKHCCALLDVKH